MAIGSTEIVILVVFGILIFGANKIPQLARGVGRAKGEFQMGMKEASEMAAIGDMDRGGMTEDIANFALYLASDESAWTTGVVVPIDGGMTAV